MTAARPITIVGAGGHGRETLDIVEAIAATNPERFRFAGFTDDGDRDGSLLTRRNIAVERTVAELIESDLHYVIAIGDPKTRAEVGSRLDPDRAAQLVHPLASVGSDHRFGPGVLLAAGARVTTNVHLGAHTHLNPNTVVSHDSRIGDYVSLSPGAVVCGNVTIGDRVLLGAGAVVLPGCTVGSDAIVGAGAVVVDDVDSGRTVVGTPAR